MLKHSYKFLFDLVQKIFLFQIGMNKQVMVFKFRQMVVRILNLNVNLARFLFSLLKVEMKKIVMEFEDDLMVGLSMKKIHLCMKISFILLKKLQKSIYKGSLALDETKIMPKDDHQDLMSLGISN